MTCICMIYFLHYYHFIHLLSNLKCMTKTNLLRKKCFKNQINELYSLIHYEYVFLKQTEAVEDDNDDSACDSLGYLLRI